MVAEFGLGVFFGPRVSPVRAPEDVTERRH
jgi:hypothetical protein